MNKYSEKLKKVAHKVSTNAQKSSSDKDIPYVVQKGNRVVRVHSNGNEEVVKDSVAKSVRTEKLRFHLNK
jgi:DNA-binding protein YbaB